MGSSKYRYLREMEGSQVGEASYIRDIEDELELFLSAPTYDKLTHLQRLTAAFLRYALVRDDSRLLGKFLDLLSRQWVLEYGMVRDTAMHQMAHLQSLILSALEEEPRAREKVMRLLLDTAAKSLTPPGSDAPTATVDRDSTQAFAEEQPDESA